MEYAGEFPSSEYCCYIIFVRICDKVIIQSLFIN
jgi:hypothetical protein